MDETLVLKDPKTRLQEHLQAQGRALPVYTVLDVTGEDHAQRFRVHCAVQGADPCDGAGSTRRQAEQDAAARMLQQLAADQSHGC